MGECARLGIPDKVSLSFRWTSSAGAAAGVAVWIVVVVLTLSEHYHLLSLKAELTTGQNASRTSHLDYGPMTVFLHRSKLKLAPFQVDPHALVVPVPADPGRA